MPLPVEVIADLLGMPDTDIPRIAAWSEAAIPGAPITDPDEVMALMGEMSTELMELAAARRAEPGEDLISLVTLAEFEGAPAPRRRDHDVPDPATRRRQRDHAQHAVGQPGRLRGTSRPVATAPGRPDGDPPRGRGDAAMDDAGDLVHADRDRRHASSTVSTSRPAITC